MTHLPGAPRPACPPPRARGHHAHYYYSLPPFLPFAALNFLHTTTQHHRDSVEVYIVKRDPALPEPRVSVELLEGKCTLAVRERKVLDVPATCLIVRYNGWRVHTWLEQRWGGMTEEELYKLKSTVYSGN